MRSLLQLVDMGHEGYNGGNRRVSAGSTTPLDQEIFIKMQFFHTLADPDCVPVWAGADGRM